MTDKTIPMVGLFDDTETFDDIEKLSPSETLKNWFSSNSFNAFEKINSFEGTIIQSLNNHDLYKKNVKIECLNKSDKFKVGAEHATLLGYLSNESSDARKIVIKFYFNEQKIFRMLKKHKDELFIKKFSKNE